MVAWPRNHRLGLMRVFASIDFGAILLSMTVVDSLWILSDMNLDMTRGQARRR